METDIYQLGYKQLNQFQKEVLDECYQKKSAALSCPLGSGKTLISLVLSLRLTQGPILIVVSKSLITNWEDEIKKFFGDKLSYKVIHPSVTDISQWQLKKSRQIYLTTIDVLAKAYKDCMIDKQFIEQKFVQTHGRLGNYVNYYKVPHAPYLTHAIGIGLMYSIKWGCLIVDEAQMYTNIATQCCQALGAVYAKHRWLLSGTLFDEPKAERILGYHIILNVPTKPRNLPDTKKLIKSDSFKGLNEHIVHRAANLAFIPPKVNQQIITHPLHKNEATIYCMMRKILIVMKEKAHNAKLINDQVGFKLFNGYTLVMLLYLRQAIIHPLIPITSIVLDTMDFENKSELSKIILQELKTLQLDKYLNNKKSIISSRFSRILDVLDKYCVDKTLLFSCFVSCLDILEYLLNYSSISNRPIFHMTSNMSLKQQSNLIKNFKQTEHGILLITFELGAQGLNLQFAVNVLLCDYWWNAAKTQQAIGRINRLGQMANIINIFFFSANTAIEKVIYEKQYAKLQILDELKEGKQKTKIPKIKMDDVIKMIECEVNREKLEKIKCI
ncbi:MAG TPA: DEAD/DEAH box helicase [Candidatus Saccharimonadales bacterium]|nr:DEAD/DEAH box helicase [Candidatus Saccharimonadales bacterium]